MGRSIPHGARVHVVAAPRPHRGEVWAMCSDDGHVVVHRVLGLVGGQWWLRGDTNSSPDRPVASERLIGRVSEIDVAGRARRLGPLDRWIGRLRLDGLAVRTRMLAAPARIRGAISRWRGNAR
jgi:hypothetical protein